MNNTIDSTLLKISLAGLMHDIGKFAAAGNMQLPAGYQSNNAALFQRTNKDHKYTHIHALYTAAFIEHPEIKPYLPAELNDPKWGIGDCFINCAAMHHKPESALQEIITVADCLSSGIDRQDYSEGQGSLDYRDYQRVRLVPILEKLSTDGQAHAQYKDSFSYYYSLERLSADSIFPKASKTLPPRKDAKHEYADLFNNFLGILKSGTFLEYPIELWIECFDSLLMLFMSAIPADRGGSKIPDISLYEHSRGTAALAAALFQYHQGNNSLQSKSIREGKEKKFLMISGDFYGIQSFIFGGYGDTHKYRSKMLRGRSFAVSLYSELAADLICRRLGLTFLSLVFNAAGKFTIIAPNTRHVKDALDSVEDEINEWMVREASYGETTIGISSLAVRADDFSGGRYQFLQEELGNRIEEKKHRRFSLNKFGGKIDGYLERISEHGLCSLCGRKPADIDAEEDSYLFGGQSISVCSLCRDQIFLGTNCVKAGRILQIIAADDKYNKKGNGLKLPAFGVYQVAFNAARGSEQGLIVPGVLRCWQFIDPETEEINYQKGAFKYSAGYVPLYQEDDKYDDRLSNRDEMAVGNPITFTHLSQKAKRNSGEELVGIEALGVLKADIDNLGSLFSDGLPHDSYTFSRISTLSRQINSFFCVYLPHLLAKEPQFRYSYTVFAGGDDLFLIGPWPVMSDLARFISKRFSEYVCLNPGVHLSASVSVHKDKTPLDRFAMLAEEALEHAKEGDKNAINIFSKTVSFSQLPAIDGARQHLEDWLRKGWLSRGQLYRLNEFIVMAEKEGRILSNECEAVPMRLLRSLRWRGLLLYVLERNVGLSLNEKDRQVVLREVSTKLVSWLEDFRGNFKIALWELLYRERRG